MQVVARNGSRSDGGASSGWRILDCRPCGFLVEIDGNPKTAVHDTSGKGVVITSGRPASASIMWALAICVLLSSFHDIHFGAGGGQVQSLQPAAMQQAADEEISRSGRRKQKKILLPFWSLKNGPERGQHSREIQMMGAEPKCNRCPPAKALCGVR